METERIRLGGKHLDPPWHILMYAQWWLLRLAELRQKRETLGDISESTTFSLAPRFLLLSAARTKSRVTRDSAKGANFQKNPIDHPFRLNLLPSSDPCDLNLLLSLSLYICMYMYIYIYSRSTLRTLFSPILTRVYTFYSLEWNILFSPQSLYFFTSIEKYNIPRRYASWKILSIDGFAPL